MVQVPASFDRIGIRVGSPPSNWYHATSGLFLDTGNFRTEAYFDPTVYPASGGTPVFELDGHDGAVLAVAATEERLATSDGSVTVGTADGQRLVELPGLSSVTDIAWHPDGRRLATAEERQLSIWDTDSADEPMVDFSIGNDVRAIEFSADGSLLLTTGTGGVVEGWSVTDGTPQLLIFLGFNRNVGALDVSPIGQLVATVNNDGTVLVLDLTTGEVTAEAVVHLFDGTAIAYSPDGTLLATGSLDGTVAILDAETLEERFRITLDAAVVAVAFSPDGSEFVVGDAGGRVGRLSRNLHRPARPSPDARDPGTHRRRVPPLPPRGLREDSRHAAWYYKSAGGGTRTHIGENPTRS